MEGSGRNGARRYQCRWRNRHATRSKSTASAGLAIARKVSASNSRDQVMTDNLAMNRLRRDGICRLSRGALSIQAGVARVFNPTPMLLDEYQQLSARTLGACRTHEQQLANAALGLTGEAGEVADIIKKHLYHATPLDKEALVKELGDCLWYLATFGTVLGISLEDIAQRNVDKLRQRYPAGFDTERSRNRTA